MMNKLPFLKENSWPKIRKYAGEKKYGFDEDDELIESSLNELIHAIETKDHQLMLGALSALIECIVAREDKEDALNSFEEASGV
jgi:hypothetical protein